MEVGNLNERRSVRGETGFAARSGMCIPAGLFLLLLALAMTACGNSVEDPIEPVADQAAQGQSRTVTDAPDEGKAPVEANSVTADWADSPHADTYVLNDAGANSTCAACHAPMQWIPSMEDMPESCSTCKFEVDPPPPTITETDWTHVECKVCHAEKKGEIQPEVLWLEIAPIEEYAEVSSHTELCQKCHLAGELAGHASVQVSGDHAGYECTECHQAHSAQASCSAQGCHDEVLDPALGIPGHDDQHANVRCVACHDAGDLQVGPDPETGEWTTFITGENEDVGPRPFVSHDTRLEVDCERCHYPGNPWELSTEVEGASDTE